MENLIPYTIRLPREIKAALPAAARRHGFVKAPELVRTVLAMIASGEVTLTLKQEEPHHEQSSPAAD